MFQAETRSTCALILLASMLLVTPTLLAQKSQPRSSIDKSQVKSSAQAASTITLPFLPPVSYEISGDRAVSVAVADVNADSISDLIVGGSDGVNILLGGGSGGFGTATLLDSGGLFSHVVVADINGDGDPDLVLVNECGAFDGSCRKS